MRHFEELVGKNVKKKSVHETTTAMQQYLLEVEKRHRENKNTLVLDVENKRHVTISIQ